jgi:AraC-like DNA-binding protein
MTRVSRTQNVPISRASVLQYPAATDIEQSVKAAFPTPIYQSGVDRFEIDDCGPQFTAVREGKIELHALSKGHYPGKRMKSNILPGLTSLGFWNCRGAQDWGLEAHRNEGLEIVLLETGGMGFEVDGKFHSLQAGNFTVTRPWQLHKLGDPNIGRGRLYWLILDVGVRGPNQEWIWPSWVVLSPKDLGELTRKLRRGEQSVWVASSRMRQVFRDLAECVIHWNEPRVGSRLVVAVNRLLVELLDVLADQQLEEVPSLVTRRRTVELFLSDLMENPTSCAEAWTLEGMAEQCGMGITAMAKYCRELVNIGPMSFLNQCRLDHAAKDLRKQPTRSITEIAMIVGFNSSQYFATSFRKRYRMTPMQYRGPARIVRSK